MNKIGAFTLVELAIVIVIIGLLVGGVLQGKALIDAANVNRAITDFKAYHSATTTFKDKYKGLPGDIANGSTLFPNCGANVGDGDGSIDWAGAPNEDLSTWCHLSQAKLIKGAYRGNAYAGGTYQIGFNAPESPYKGAGFWMASAVGGGGQDFRNLVYGLSGNRIVIGNLGNSTQMWFGALIADDAFNLDTKMDDGIPNTGKIIVVNGVSQSGCISSNTYMLSSASQATCNINYFFEN